MKILIVGLGAIAKKHIKALLQLNSKAEIYALRSSANAASEENIVNLYNINEAKQLKIDFAVITNPTALHKQAIIDLSDLGIPLFIEKPLFNELQAEDILAMLVEKKILTYVACNLRFLECLQFAKKFIQAKRINEVNIYCGSYLPDWRPNTDFRKSYSANRELGGGVHIDLIHEIDYTYWLFGQPINSYKTFQSSSSLQINAIDYANYLLIFDSFCANIVLNYYRKDAKREAEMVCADGTCKVDLLANTVSWNGEIVFESWQRITDTYLDQMRYFTEGVLENKISMNTAAEAYEVLKICLQE